MEILSVSTRAPRAIFGRPIKGHRSKAIVNFSPSPEIHSVPASASMYLLKASNCAANTEHSNQFNPASSTRTCIKESKALQLLEYSKALGHQTMRCLSLLLNQGIKFQAVFQLWQVVLPQSLDVLNQRPFHLVSFNWVGIGQYIQKFEVPHVVSNNHQAQPNCKKSQLRVVAHQLAKVGQPAPQLNRCRDAAAVEVVYSRLAGLHMSRFKGTKALDRLAPPSHEIFGHFERLFLQQLHFP